MDSQLTLNPAKKLKGRIEVPSDKSLTHRSILLSSLGLGSSQINNPLLSEDCLSTAHCMESLGVKIKREGKTWLVEGKGLWGFQKPSAPLNCGNSGTTMRLLSGILAAQEFESELFGDASLSKRPMDRVSKPLEKMGAQFYLQNEKYAPFKIKGTRKLKPIHWKNPVASAQVKSSVLLAALHTNGETIFEEPSLSRDHTERMFLACGVILKTEGTKIRLMGPSQLKSQIWDIPGDPSSAAFFVVAGLLFPGAELSLQSVNLNPTRIGFIEVLQSAGANIDFNNKRLVCGEPCADISVKSQKRLNAFKIDEEMAPKLIDEIPILAVAATQAQGMSTFKGIGELRVKETDRITAIVENLQKMGAKIRELPDGFTIEGPTALRGAEIKSFDDHRIAMSGAVASLIASSQTHIVGSESVAISFPTFWETLRKLTE
ncbi:MAG: 3-phosphoshikimate 1-carboxyvinyltransferase [Elusimicrobiota bacterium]